MMKVGMNLAVLALIGKVSAEEISSMQKHHQQQIKPQKFHVDAQGFIVFNDQKLSQQKHKSKAHSKNKNKDLPSNEVANGDVDDDKELSDTDDEADHNVQDYGFGLGAHRNVLPPNGKTLMTRSRDIPSNEVANGDVCEDKELEDTDDEDDFIVQDYGFGLGAHRNTIFYNNVQTGSKVRDIPSNEVANGDVDEDKELEDTDDEDDFIVQDYGFGLGAHRNTIMYNNVQTAAKIRDIPSNEVANGDVCEDKELEDTDDEDDFIVQDYGFGLGAHRNTITIQNVQLASKMRDIPSNEVANGDIDEDKELEDTDDEDDFIVQDYGFGLGAHRNTIISQNVQLASTVRDIPSNEVANGDIDEDKELEDTDDEDDFIVQDYGFGLGAHRNTIISQNVQLGDLQKEDKKHHHQMKHLNNKMHNAAQEDTYSDEIANGDPKDDMQVEDQVDQNDWNVDENGYIQLSNNLVLHRKPKGVRMINDMNIQLGKYSDELANGDSADNREIHEEEDMGDDVVDYNGQTNAGYGSRVPSAYFADNHILPGHFTNVQLPPQDDSFVQLQSTHEPIKEGHYWKDIQTLAQKENIV